jgi:phenylalanyl-tRNA synthetase beta chain
MLISYNWLRELTEIRLKPLELRDRLTSVGLAVDGVDEAGDDFVLDVDVASNRPDCLSHLGVAREVAVIEDGEVHLKSKVPSRVKGRVAELTSVEIEDAELCPRYAARVVRGVTIKPSPGWLVKRLEAIGQRPINNVADITNYVMHELGQPLHAFDFATLFEQRIVVRRAGNGEKLKTLDEVERTLTEEMLVIADAKQAVALAGIMGGALTEISNETRDVLIESAYFNPDAVRRTARALGMQTEASRRFERGTDYKGVLRAQERCVALICELAGGTATEDTIDAYPKRLKTIDVSLRSERVKALTGLEVKHAEIIRILTALGFAERERATGIEAEPSLRDGVFEEMSVDLNREMTYVVPSWRVDVRIEEDLVEEVARHVGYEKIAAELPASNIAGEYQPEEAKKRAMRRALVECGYNEAVSFSFIDAASDGRVELIPKFENDEGEDETRSYVTLSNPIIEGVTRMRPTLIPGLLDAVRNNFNHGTRDVRLFEIGAVFLPEVTVENQEGAQMPREREAFALVATGGANEEGRAEASRALDFYDLKGALEAAVDALRLPPLRFAPAAGVRHLREGQAAGVYLEGHKVGHLGRLGETIATEYKFRQPIYVAEVDLSALLEIREAPVLYAPLARYPSIVRDLSLLIERRVTLAEMLDTINRLGLENCRDCLLVDVYEGANLPQTKRSVTLRLEYRDAERTLRDEEVDRMHTQVVGALVEKFNAERR